MIIFDTQMSLPWLEGEILAQWCKDNGIEPRDTYRLEIDELTMEVQVYQYERNAEGAFYTIDVGPTLQIIAKKKPFKIKTTSLPEV